MRCLISNLRRVNIIYRRTNNRTTFISTNGLLPRVPTSRFPTRTLTYRLCGITNVHTMRVNSFLLNHSPGANGRLPYPTRLLHLAVPHTACARARVSFVVRTFGRIGRGTTGVGKLAFACRPGMLHRFATGLGRIWLVLRDNCGSIDRSLALRPRWRG